MKAIIIAGEASGDIIGARLINALKYGEDNSNIAWNFRGIGGQEMLQAGLSPLQAASIQDINLMGFIEVIPRIFHLIECLNRIVDEILQYNPDIVITIDSYGFNFRLVKKLRQTLNNTKFVHYVAPTVWAYKPGRAKICAQLYDHLLTILPFEAPYFTEYGLPVTFVGHPVLEQEIYPAQTVDLVAKSQNITIFPGSRRQEVDRHLKIFLESVRDLGFKKCFIPTFPNFLAQIEDISAKFPDLDLHPIIGQQDKWHAVQQSEIALVKSGTIAVEMLRYQTPMVVAYKANWLTEWLIKRIIGIRYCTIANLLLDRPAIPELVLENCTAYKISKAAEEILRHSDIKEGQVAAYKEAIALLQTESGLTPSRAAAQTILKLTQEL